MASRVSGVDGHGQVIDVHVSPRRDIASARRFFAMAIADHSAPEEIVTDKSAALANVIDELVPRALHNTIKYANNRVDCSRRRPARLLSRCERAVAGPACF